MTANLKKPGTGARRISERVAGLRTLYGRANWRDRMPNPTGYYAKHVAKLSRPNQAGWAQGLCPFHEDRNTSLSVHLGDARGGWRCFAGCGGGDLVGFHMRKTGKPFQEAVADLLRGGA